MTPVCPSRPFASLALRVTRFTCSTVALTALLAACGPSTPPAQGPEPSAGGAPAESASDSKMAAAEKYILAKQWDSAKSVLAGEVSSNPKNAKAVFYLGLCAENTGDAEGAKQHYKKALEIDPKLVDAAVNLSAMSLDAKDPASALPVIQQGLAADPQNPKLLTNRALALDDLGKSDEAAKAYVAALQVMPDDLQLRSAYADLLVRNKKKDEAIKQLKIVVDKTDDSTMLVAASTWYVRLEAYQECVGVLDKAAKAKATAEVFVRRGLCKHGLNDEDGALKDFEQAVSTDDKSAPAHYYYGRALVAKDSAKALEQLTKAADLDPNGDIGKRAKAEIETLKAGSKAPPKDTKKKGKK